MVNNREDEMFRINGSVGATGEFWIHWDDVNQFSHYLHSDGSILTTREYWPTRQAAQVILNKYSDAKVPEPQHEWEHGDVFRNDVDTTMIFIKSCEFGGFEQSFCTNTCHCGRDMNHDIRTMSNPKFLFNIFNIKDKIDE